MIWKKVGTDQSLCGILFRGTCAVPDRHFLNDSSQWKFFDEIFLILFVRALLIEAGRVFGRVVHVWRAGLVVAVGKGRRSSVAGRAGSVTAAPHLAHLIAPLPHQHLVLGDAHLLAVDDASALGTRSVTVVRMLLHMQLRQPRLLFIIRLLV